ncbi:hypothetical protein DAPPPG734_12885 [Pantoea agglomerans]|uniref:Uncharacterized protein n=1 Tax=Enterobacter agglomerans TaxID=549 RepID=A0AAN2FDH0_ENTAG|nr:hypothetical protein DAPPPG734_12885 [Pantoea agglomerans]
MIFSRLFNLRRLQACFRCRADCYCINHSNMASFCSLLTARSNFGPVFPLRRILSPCQKPAFFYSGFSGHLILSASSVFTRISMTRYFFQAISWLASSPVAIPKSTASCRGCIIVLASALSLMRLFSAWLISSSAAGNGCSVRHGRRSAPQAISFPFACPESKSDHSLSVIWIASLGITTLISGS